MGGSRFKSQLGQKFTYQKEKKKKKKITSLVSVSYVVNCHLLSHSCVIFLFWKDYLSLRRLTQ